MTSLLAIEDVVLKFRTATVSDILLLYNFPFYNLISRSPNIRVEQWTISLQRCLVFGVWIIFVKCRASHGAFMEHFMRDHVPLGF